MSDRIDQFAARIWRKAMDATRRALADPTDRAHAMSFVALHSFEAALEGELERGPEVARSLLTSMLEDVARNLSRDGRTVRITVDWREGA